MAAGAEGYTGGGHSAGAGDTVGIPVPAEIPRWGPMPVEIPRCWLALGGVHRVLQSRGAVLRLEAPCRKRHARRDAPTLPSAGAI